MFFCCRSQISLERDTKVDVHKSLATQTVVRRSENQLTGGDGGADCSDDFHATFMSQFITEHRKLSLQIKKFVELFRTH